MATRTWTGSSANFKDLWTLTTALTWAQGDTATITINGKSLVITIGALVTVAQVSLTIKQAWQSIAFTDTLASCNPSGGGESIPEMAGITASVAGAIDGLCFLGADGFNTYAITVSYVTAGNGTLAIAHTTTATGSYYYDNTGNWSGATLPVTSDSVIISRPVSIQYGALDQSAVTLTDMSIEESFTASIGIPDRNPYGYEEYDATRLKIKSTKITDKGSSPLTRINTSTAQTNVSLLGSSVFDWIGTHASNVFSITSGKAYLAFYPQEAATILTLNVSGGVVYGGSGLTLGTVNKTGGDIWLYNGTTLISNTAGSVYLKSGTHTQVAIGGGTLVASSDAVITTLRVTGGTASTGIQVATTTVNKTAGTLVMEVAPTTTLSSASGVTNCKTGGISGVTTITGGTFYYGGTGTIASLVTTGSATINFDGGTNAACTVSANSIGVGTKIIDSAKRVVWTGGLIPPAGTITFS